MNCFRSLGITINLRGSSAVDVRHLSLIKAVKRRVNCIYIDASGKKNLAVSLFTISSLSWVTNLGVFLILIVSIFFIVYSFV